MPRVRKGAARAQARKRILRAARGYYGVKSRHKYQARNALIRAGVYAYRDRRNRKRDMRSLWIIRITAACRMRGERYSRFINGLKLAGINLNRKMLSQLAIEDPKAFDEIVAIARQSARATEPAAAAAAPVTAGV
ncbi:MAG TPA: 50S ribosomal protein L20 [Phycisphaerales bacterium]|nr:50S ribosomal protein L20 [Phycisphaerales bacterium]